MDKKILLDAFVDRFPTGGHSHIECGYCGRDHFDTSDQGCFEDGELERLTAAAEREPDRFIPTDGSIYWVQYGALAIVVDCPCKSAETIAMVLWDNRRQIVAFLESVASKNLATAASDVGILGRVKDL